MARSPRPGPRTGTPEWRERRLQGIDRWKQRRREMARVAPSELLELEKTGTVSPSLKPYAVQTIEEADALALALGGAEHVSPQRLVLIQDCARVGLVMRAVLARFLQGDGDPELASKVATMASTRRALLSALGLERVEKELDLHAYIAAKASQDAAQRANGGTCDHGATDAEELAVGAKAAQAVTLEESTADGIVHPPSGDRGASDGPGRPAVHGAGGGTPASRPDAPPLGVSPPNPAAHSMDSPDGGDKEDPS